MVAAARGEKTLSRLAHDVRAALRRRPATEERLAGAALVLSRHAPSIRAALAEAGSTLGRRGAHDRPLFWASTRALCEAGDPRATRLVEGALSASDEPCLPVITAACFSADPRLAAPLERLARTRHPSVAFAAEVARVARGESNGALMPALATRLNEPHRVAVCIDVLLPLRDGPVLSGAHVAEALTVLRQSERHLGRWLVIAEVAARMGDRAALDEASERESSAPEASQRSWSLLAWALRGGEAPAPLRAGFDVMARLSDRPTVQRDTSFLFRVAESGAPGARPLLESLAGNLASPDAAKVRAAYYLARDHGRSDLREALRKMAAERRDEAKGTAVAALFDLGDRDHALACTDVEPAARSVPMIAWCGLVRAVASADAPERVLSLKSFRRISEGWLDLPRAPRQGRPRPALRAPARGPRPGRAPRRRLRRRRSGPRRRPVALVARDHPTRPLARPRRRPRRHRREHLPRRRRQPHRRSRSSLRAPLLRARRALRR